MIYYDRQDLLVMHLQKLCICSVKDIYHTSTADRLDQQCNSECDIALTKPYIKQVNIELLTF